MKLSAIVDLIVTTLNTSPPEKWTGLKVGSDVMAVPAIDPIDSFSSTKLQLYILPEMVQYDLDESARRENVKILAKAKYVSIVTVKKLVTEETTGDITTWAEGKQILDLKEEVDDFLVRYNWSSSGLKVVDIESGPPDEVQLEGRRFLSLTQIGFEVIECPVNSALGSASTLRGSLRGSRLAKGLHSTNSPGRSGRLAGPHLE